MFDLAGGHVQPVVAVCSTHWWSCSAVVAVSLTLRGVVVQPEVAVS